jgi:hypothetical protein
MTDNAPSRTLLQTIMQSLSLSASIMVNASIGISLGDAMTEKRLPKLSDVFFRIDGVEANIAAALTNLHYPIRVPGIATIDIRGANISASLQCRLRKPITLTSETLKALRAPSSSEAMEQDDQSMFVFNGTISAIVPTLLTVTDPSVRGLVSDAGALFMYHDQNIFDGVSGDFELNIALTPGLASALSKAFGSLARIGDALSASTITNTILPVIDSSLNGLLKHPDGPNTGDFFNFTECIVPFFAMPLQPIPRYRTPTDPTVTIDGVIYPSLVGVLELLPQRVNNVFGDAFQGSGGNNGSGVFVGGGFNSKTKQLQVNVAIIGTIGTQLTPNLAADTGIGLELDTKLSLDLRSSLILNVSILIDISKSYTNPDTTITVHDFKLNGVSIFSFISDFMYLIYVCLVEC